MDDDFANMAHLDALMKDALAQSQWFTELANTVSLRKKALAEAKHNSVEIQGKRFMDCLLRRFRFLLTPIPTTLSLGEIWEKHCYIDAWRQIDGTHYVQFVVTQGASTKLRFSFPAMAICATYTEDVLSLLFAYLDQKGYLVYCTDMPSTPVTLDLTFSTPRANFVQL